MVQEPAVMVMAESGMGYVPAVALNTESHFEMFDTSAILVESLALEDCELKLRNAIVARMARITITTISSTRVKPRSCHSERSETQPKNPFQLSWFLFL
jgi:hypothetical protein